MKPLQLPPRRRPMDRLTVAFARFPAEIEEAQRLRHRIFCGELGARLHSLKTGLDMDRFDPYCHHLLVKDRALNKVVGCTRILTDSQAAMAGGFYSETEFDLSRILMLPGRFMEIGRTCVHPDYRTGATISLLWLGLARFMAAYGYDHLIGCASIPLHSDDCQALPVIDYLRRHHLSPEHLRAYPKRPLPARDVTAMGTVNIPALLKGYLRLGARVCGEPCWDPDFNVADVFVLLMRARLNQRYARRFVERRSQPRAA